MWNWSLFARYVLYVSTYIAPAVALEEMKKIFFSGEKWKSAFQERKKFDSLKIFAILPQNEKKFDKEVFFTKFFMSLILFIEQSEGGKRQQTCIALYRSIDLNNNKDSGWKQK